MSNIYVAPLASGNGSGSSAANAMAFSSLNTAIKAAGAGGTVLMLADQGTYRTTGTVTLTAGGTDAAPVTLRGVNSAGVPTDIQITGTRAAYEKGMTQVGNDVFRLLSGANNLNFEGFDFHNVQTGFRFGADVRNITIQNMEATNVRWFINDVVSGSNTSASVSGLTVRDVVVDGFSRGVITLRYDSNNVLIERVVGDSKYQDGDGLATGVFMDGTVHNVVIRDSTMMNAIATSATGTYWNGDGFTAEERVYNLRFENTRAIGNADGGYDIKASNVVMTNAFSEDNGKNYRFWGQNVELVNPTGIDPHIRGGNSFQAQMWVADGARVSVTGGNFADSGSATRVFDSSGTLTFNGTNVWYGDGSTLTTGSGISGLASSLVHKVSATGRYSTTGENLFSDTTTVVTVPTVTEPVAPSTSLTGTSSGDVLSATSDADWTISGAGGNDTLTGRAGNDRLLGGSGNDTIKGGAGNDVIIGNSGVDVLTGGTGSDVFSFLALSDSSASSLSTRDKIVDFEHGVDRIDLAALDANAGLSGDQAFSFIGEGVFTRSAGQLRVDYRDPLLTKVFADVNGDGAADFAIHLPGHVTLTSGDFLL